MTLKSFNFIQHSNYYRSFDSRIEKDLLDAAIHALLEKREPPKSWKICNHRCRMWQLKKDSLDGQHGIEVCFAIVFLVKLSEVYENHRSPLTRMIRSYKRFWFKGLSLTVTSFFGNERDSIKIAPETPPEI